MFLPDVFRQVRLSRGFTVPELAVMLDLTDKSVYEWELGRQNPHPENVRRAADIMGVDGAMFYRGPAPWEEEDDILDCPLPEFLDRMRNIYPDWDDFLAWCQEREG